MTFAEENRPIRSTYLSVEQQELLFAKEFPDLDVEPHHRVPAARAEHPPVVRQRRPSETSGTAGSTGGASLNPALPAGVAAGPTAAPGAPHLMTPAIGQRLNLFPPALLAGPAVWIGARSVRSGRAPGGEAVPKSWGASQAEALSRLRNRSSRKREQMITALASLAAYKVLTLEQWADTTGLPELRHADNRLAADLFCVGTVQFAHYPGLTAEVVDRRRATRRREPAELVRLGDPRAARDFVGGLTDVERAVVTGFEPWPQPSDYHLRHDVLANELVLRVAELHGVTGVVLGVLGEPLSRHHFLNGSEAASRETKPARCDGAAVRADDFIIAFEVVNAINTKGALAKAERASRLVAGEDPYWRGSRSRNVAVIFVIVTPDERSERVRVTNKLCSSLRHQLRLSTEAWKHIGVVNWHDWFPAPGVASTAFEGLAAHRFDLLKQEFDLSGANRMVPFLDVPKVAERASNRGEREESFGDAVRMMEHNPPWLRHPDARDRRRHAIQRMVRRDLPTFR